MYQTRYFDFYFKMDANYQGSSPVDWDRSRFTTDDSYVDWEIMIFFYSLFCWYVSGAYSPLNDRETPSDDRGIFFKYFESDHFSIEWGLLGNYTGFILSFFYIKK